MKRSALVGKDAYYTPFDVARIMVLSASTRQPNLIADYAAGEGELLRAALEKWPGAKVVCSDIDASIVARLRRKNPEWRTGKCDFLKTSSRRRCTVLAKNPFPDVILLNPPFSGRGGAAVTIDVFGLSLRASIAAAFTLVAASRVRKGGEILALLPAGTMHSQKDADAWALLGRVGTVTIVQEWGKSTFVGCAPKTVLVRFRRRRIRPESKSVAVLPVDTRATRVAISVRLERGRVSVHKGKATPSCAKVPFVHSTELRDGNVNFNARRIDARLPTFAGPAVLLPRVGTPLRHKIAILGSAKQVVLSDCILALRCKSLHEAAWLRARLLLSWDEISALFTGTCARYITCAALVQHLRSIGVVVESSNVAHSWLKSMHRRRASSIAREEIQTLISPARENMLSKPQDSRVTA